MRTRTLRFALFILVTAGFVPTALVSIRDHLEMIGRPVPGFFFHGPVGRVALESRMATNAGLRDSDEVIEINGTRYVAGTDPRPLVHTELGESIICWFAVTARSCRSTSRFTPPPSASSSRMQELGF